MMKAAVVDSSTVLNGQALAVCASSNPTILQPHSGTQCHKETSDIAPATCRRPLQQSWMLQVQVATGTQ